MASKPHVLQFSLSVLPVKILGGVYGLIILINQNYISKMSIFYQHENTETFLGDCRPFALAFSEAA